MADRADLMMRERDVKNLVDWRQWGLPLAREARETDRPVLLVLEQFWCGLSRLLHVTAWSDPAVAQAVNASFIPVRVDADRRPDIDQRYSLGAWPAVVFLTPELRPIAGTPFVPPDVLLDAINSVAALFSDNREEIAERVERVQADADAYEAGRIDSSRSPSPWMTSRILDILRERSDPDNGGFGTAPKFPNFDALDMILEVYARAGDDKLLGIATSALDGMTQSGLYDWEDGGFFRCSDAADWSSPRLEKLLLDQARHLRVLLRAHELSGDLEYREAAEGVLEYIARVLYEPATGCFHNAQAADPEYFQLSREERERGRRPLTDATLMAHSQSQIGRSLLSAGRRLGKPALVEQGLRALEVLIERLCPEDDLVNHYWSGSARVRGLLSDQADVGLALLDAAAAASDDRFLARALRLAELVQERLSDPRQAGYFDSDNPLGLQLLWARSKSFESNTALAVFFGRLAAATGDEAWRDRAVVALAGFTGVWDRLGVLSARYGLGLLEAFGGG